MFSDIADHLPVAIHMTTSIERSKTISYLDEYLTINLLQTF